ncbi:MAG: acyltransferase family protein [Pseudonocardia sp.]
MGDPAQVAPVRIRPVAPRVGIPHLPGLDGLRAVAVAAVLAYHTEEGWAQGGFLGVEVFFTISGYLVTSLLLAEAARRGRVDLGEFYRARGRRLLPGLAVCVLGTLAAYHLLLPGAVPGLRDDAIAALAYVHNWLLVLEHVPYSASFERPSPMLHLWSLAIEGQLYLLWPVALLGGLAVFGRRVVAALTAVLAGFSAAAMAALYDPTDVGRVYFGTDTRAAGFLLGATLALCCLPWLRSRVVPVRARILDLAAAMALALLAVALITTSEFVDALYVEGGFAKVGLLTAVVIAAVAYPGTRISEGLGRRPLVWLGQRSYGVYLYHWPVFVLTRPGVDVPDIGLLTDLARVGMTLVIAALSYRWIEVPVRRGALGRWRSRARSMPRDRGAQRCGGIPAGWLGGDPAGRLGWIPAGRLGGDPARRLGWVPALCGAGVLVGILVLSSGPAPAPQPATGPLAGTDVAAAPAAQPTVPAVVTPPPAIGAAPSASPGLPAAALPSSGAPLVVGDSVVLGSADALRAALGSNTTVDGLMSRQFDRGPAIVATWAATHRGPVVVHLGSNGIVRAADIDAIVAAAGARKVVLVNVAVPRRWQRPNNAALQAAALRYPNRVVLVDWASLVAADPSLLGPDQVHPTARGRAALAAAVRAALTTP